MENNTDESGSVDNPKEPEANYLLRLFRGDIPLVITYWVFGALVANVLVNICVYLIDLNYAAIVSTAGGMGLYYTLVVLLVFVSIFIWIAIWRSAGKYQGNKLWGVLARVMVLLAVLVSLVDFYKGYVISQDPYLAMRDEMARINPSLPMMIDEATRWDSLSIEGEDIYYRYTIMDDEMIESSLGLLSPDLHKHIIIERCEDSRAVLESGGKYIYSYKNTGGQTVLELAVSIDDCT